MDICNQARIHANLAREVLKTKDGLLARAYAIWAVARTTGLAHFGRDELLTLVSDRTGRTRPTVRKWLNAAIRAGLFIEGSRDRLSLVGKHRVFEALLPEGQTPGFVVYVDTDRLLTASLADLRASLYGTQFCKKTTWMSRETIRELSGPTKKTQLRYDSLNNQRKRYSFCVDRATGEAHQMPNLYQRAPGFFRPATKRQSRTDHNGNGQKTRDGLSGCLSRGRSFDRQNVTGQRVDLSECRLLFGDAKSAEKASRRRARLGKWPVTFSFTQPEHVTRTANRRGYVFLESHITT